MQAVPEGANNNDYKRGESVSPVFVASTFHPFDRMHTKAYNVCMEEQKYTVLRVRKTTRDTLKLVSVLSHESMVETIDRLARQELGRLQKSQGKPE
jgi:hypothetical protein